MPEADNHAREAVCSVIRKISNYDLENARAVSETILMLLWECGYKIVPLEKKDMN